MHAYRDDSAKPAWRADELASGTVPEIEAPYFDEALDSWVLSRYEDVRAAFRSLSLALAGFNSEKTTEPFDEDKRLKMREDTATALSAAQLRSWRERFAPEVQHAVDQLPSERVVDLIAEYARPLCLSLAAMVTGIGVEEAKEFSDKARVVSAAAAEPMDRELAARAKSAETALQDRFPAGPMALRSSGFVGLSQTMPAILGNAWFALLREPMQWTLLHDRPELTEQAIEELLRYAGLVRMLCRVATEDTNINGAEIRKGQRIILRLIAANRDPERFSDANRMDLAHGGAGHFALGYGPHSCVGASLIRIAAVAISQPLVERFSLARLVEAVEWRGGSCFRTPEGLPVAFTG